jgi:hypothetical protein
METLTAWIAFIAGLSVATERITEIVKGFIARTLAIEKRDDPAKEEHRKAFVQVLAIVIGGVLAFLTYDQIQGVLKLPADTSAKLGISFVFGAMASGGSGLWNSALDILREVNKQKQEITDKLKAARPVR